jgi:predicted nucleic acid-binding protein
MTDKEFVDTNILVYAHDASPAVASKHRIAKELVERLWVERTGCISLQVLQEFYTVSTRKLARPVLPSVAYEAVEDYLTWTVHTPTGEDILAAIRQHQRHHIAFWDALIIRSAQMSRCAVVWSEDLNTHQVFDGISVVNPFQA